MSINEMIIEALALPLADGAKAMRKIALAHPQEFMSDPRITAWIRTNVYTLAKMTQADFETIE